MIKPVKYDEADFKYAVIANSQFVAVGDVLIPAATSTFVLGGKNTTADLLGVVMAIVGKAGKVLELNSITASASNQTVEQVQVAYLPFSIKDIEYLADLDAVAGTTPGSDGLGTFIISVGDSGVLSEASYLSFATEQQFFSYGVDANNSKQVHVFVKKSV